MFFEQFYYIVVNKTDRLQVINSTILMIATARLYVGLTLRHVGTEHEYALPDVVVQNVRVARYYQCSLASWVVCMCALASLKEVPGTIMRSLVHFVNRCRRYIFYWGMPSSAINSLPCLISRLEHTSCTGWAWQKSNSCC